MKSRFRFLLGIAAGLLIVTASLRADDNWLLSSGSASWFSSANWSQNRSPLLNEITNIYQAHAVVNAAGATAGQINLGGTGTMSVVTGGTISLNRSTVNVGINGTGLLNIAGGTFDNSGRDGTFYLGTGATGKGTINMTSGALKTEYLTIGRNSSPSLVSSLEQTGGTVNALYVRVGDNSPGVISLNGGNIVTDSTLIGFQSSGSVTVSSGTLSSSANSSFSINIGVNYGTGVLKLTNSGAVKVGSSGTMPLSLGYAATSTNNKLIIGDNEAFSGTIQASSIQTGSGNGSVIFSQTNEYTAGLVMSGNLRVIQDGSGITTVTRTNTYTLGTVIGEGTFLINGESSTGSGTVTVEDGGVLGGTGSAAGKVFVQAGGSLAPGSATLRLNGGLELQDEAGLAFRLGTTSDLITSNGTLLVGEDIHLTVTPQDGFEEGLYSLITFTGPLTDNSNDFSGWTVSGMNGYVGEFVFNGSSLDLLVTAVPEPGSCALVLVGLAGLASRRRMRREFVN